MKQQFTPIAGLLLSFQRWGACSAIADETEDAAVRHFQLEWVGRG
jgi:hypothetical protein